MIASCASSKFRRKLLTEPNLYLERALKIGQAMENAQSHAREIENHRNSTESHDIEEAIRLTLYLRNKSFHLQHKK